LKVPRGRWVNLSITIDVRRKLDEIASALGFSSPNDVIAYLVKVYEECRKLDEVYELLKAVASALGKAPASTNTPPKPETGRAGSVADAVPKSDAESKTGIGRAGENKSSTSQDMAKNRVFCKRRSEVKDLKSYVELLEKKGLLIDWWEEGEDRICFEIDSTKLRKELS